MHTLSQILLLSLFICTSLPTSGQTPLEIAQSEYAWRAEIGNGATSLRRIELTPTQLAGATRQDLGDIAIFDALGAPAPLLIRKIPSLHEHKEVPLTFSAFTIRAGKRARTITATEQIDTEKGLSTRKTTETVAVPETRTDYVIELSETQVALGINSIELQWRGLGGDQLLKLNIESVERFDQFGQGTIRQKTLAQNTKDKEWQRINNLKAGARLHRITIDKPPTALELVAANGHYQQVTPTPLEWSEPQSMQLDSQGDNNYAFQVPAAGAASAFRLVPAETNTVLRGSLSVSNRGWQNRTQLFSDIQQHKLTATEHIKPSKQLTLPRSYYKQWWFRSNQHLNQAPAVQLGFEPREIVFYANGTEPYTLVWGNKDAPPVRNTLSDLLTDQKQLNNAETLKASKREEAGGAERLVQADNSWLSWLLWLVLGIAVALTCRMALSLLREMSAQREQE